jgi:hypothetical protein
MRGVVREGLPVRSHRYGCFAEVSFCANSQCVRRLGLTAPFDQAVNFHIVVIAAMCRLAAEHTIQNNKVNDLGDGLMLLAGRFD